MSGMSGGVPASWMWLVLGAVLVALETLAPGVLMLWFGLAALGTGVLASLVPAGAATQLLAFASLTAASLALGLRLRRPVAGDAASRLNERGATMIGRVVVTDGPIVGGRGRVRVGDAAWLAVGPDLHAGRLVRIVRVDGTVLVVEPADLNV